MHSAHHRPNCRLAAAATLTLAALLSTPAAQAMSCSASANPRPLRERGATELLADLRLECTGGRTLSPGEPLAKYQIVISADAPLTMRTMLEDDLGAIGWTEALLLVDEPAPRDQRPCVPDAQTIEEHPGALDCGAAGDEANVFQALRLQDNAVVFRDASIEPPGSGRTRILRVVNLRADVRDLAPASEEEPAGEVYLSVRIFGPDGATVPVELADQLAGRVTPAVAVEARSADNQAPANDRPALLSTPSLTPEERPEDGPTFLIRFTELAPDVFRRRNLGSNGIDPAFLTNQAVPGATPHTESGLFNGAFPNRRGLNQAGLADAGVRLRAVLDDVPSGAEVWVSYRDVEAGTTDYDEAAPRARLTAASGGAFRPLAPEDSDFVQVAATEGRVEVFWEVTASDPEGIESLAFSVGVTSSNGDIELGEATLTGDLAPAFDEEAVMIPSFGAAVEEPEPLAAFSIVPTLPLGEFVSVSAASFTIGPVASGSIVSGFAAEVGELSEDLRVDIIDSSGALREATVFASGAGQTNFLLDPKTALGPAIATVYDAGRPVAQGSLEIASVMPGLFAANGNGRGAPAGQWLTAAGEASGALAELAADGAWIPARVSVDAKEVYLVLYGTGMRQADPAVTELLADGVAVPVTFVGAQGEFDGLDQVNAGPLPSSLAGRGLVDLQVRVGATLSNRLQIHLP